MRKALLVAVVAALVQVPAAPAWSWPVDGPVLRPFVFGNDPYAADQHRGIDVGSPTGTAVAAPRGGTVSYAGTVPHGGKTVTIETGDGYSVTLVHLGSIDVRRGATVAEGDVVGTVGPSGAPEGPEPYVHHGVRVTAEREGYVDPLLLLPSRDAAPAPDAAAAPAGDASGSPGGTPSFEGDAEENPPDGAAPVDPLVSATALGALFLPVPPSAPAAARSPRVPTAVSGEQPAVSTAGAAEEGTISTPSPPTGGGDVVAQPPPRKADATAVTIAAVSEAPAVDAPAAPETGTTTAPPAEAGATSGADVRRPSVSSTGPPEPPADVARGRPDAATETAFEAIAAVGREVPRTLETSRRSFVAAPPASPAVGATRPRWEPRVSKMAVPNVTVAQRSARTGVGQEAAARGRA
ncbi:MAG: peptidoglycan DD-metalloendopeptidase family protein, partial [Actinomycetota bacterium]|nr:peptidoglycan DD-metalloendopeptidase family protein [Actinomycetota bacterium]